MLGAPAVWAESRCSENTDSQPATISCSYKTLAIDSGSAGKRKVVYQIPIGKAPAGGFAFKQRAHQLFCKKRIAAASRCHQFADVLEVGTGPDQRPDEMLCFPEAQLPEVDFFEVFKLYLDLV